MGNTFTAPASMRSGPSLASLYHILSSLTGARSVVSVFPDQLGPGEVNDYEDGGVGDHQEYTDNEAGD